MGSLQIVSFGAEIPPEFFSELKQKYLRVAQVHFFRKMPILFQLLLCTDYFPDRHIFEICFRNKQFINSGN